MSAMISHLARRGVQHLSSASFAPSNDDQTFADTYKMPTWGIVMLASTMLLFLLGLSMMEYTFGRLIPTLLMIETPQALLYEPLQSLEPDAPLDSKTESKSTTDSELLLIQPKPITSSFRSTILHLRAKAGYGSRFRGLAIFIVYSSFVSTLSQWIAVLPFIPYGTAPVIATVALANMSLAWTHIVISDPSPKPWYKRLPTSRTWKKVAGPTAVLAIAEQLAILGPAFLGVLIGLGDVTPQAAKEMSVSEKQVMFIKGVCVLGVAVGISLFVVVPANVTLTRVQASLLKEEEESIVPFDRSFGGKVVPEVVGGKGVLGMLDAWKTFDWNARVRLIKAYVKVVGMQIALSIFFTMVAIGQIFLIVGKSDLKKLLHGQKEGL